MTWNGLHGNHNQKHQNQDRPNANNRHLPLGQQYCGDLSAQQYQNSRSNRFCRPVKHPISPAMRVNATHVPMLSIRKQKAANIGSRSKERHKLRCEATASSRNSNRMLRARRTTLRPLQCEATLMPSPLGILEPRDTIPKLVTGAILARVALGRR